MRNYLYYCKAMFYLWLASKNRSGLSHKWEYYMLKSAQAINEIKAPNTNHPVI